MTWPYVRDVALVREDYDFGVFLNVPYLNGTIYILNLPDNYYDLLRLPPVVLNAIRRAFVKDLGVELSGPGGVALYLFGEKQYVLYNMSDEYAQMKLRFYREVPQQGWMERVKEKSLRVEIDNSSVGYGGPLITEVPVTLNPFEIAVVEAPCISLKMGSSTKKVTYIAFVSGRKSEHCNSIRDDSREIIKYRFPIRTQRTLCA